MPFKIIEATESTHGDVAVFGKCSKIVDEVILIFIFILFFYFSLFFILYILKKLE